MKNVQVQTLSKMFVHLPLHGIQFTLNSVSKLTASIILLLHNIAHPNVASGLDGRPSNSLQNGDADICINGTSV
jgi:glutaminase